MLDLLLPLIQERGPLTVAAFMDLALYHPERGYYTRASRRSGSSGDFVTSVDLGPLFGRLLARQVAEMAAALEPATQPLTLLADFDRPAMSPNCSARMDSTVAPQALYLLNSPFVLAQAKERLRGTK